MSQFFDHEAEVSEGSEDDEVREEIRRHKKTSRRIADSDEEEDDDDEDDDEDEARIREEMKDLINDDVEEEEGDSEDSEGEIGKHGHKRSREDEDEELEENLDDDDYDLIEENLGTRIERKKKFRRIKRLDEDDDEDGGQGGGGAGGRPKVITNERDAIANELFNDDDDDDDFNDAASHRSGRGGGRGPGAGDPRDRIDRQALDDHYAGIDSENSENDDDGFIVDDNDRPIASRQRTKKSERFTDQALQQAQDVFGVDFDYAEVNKYADDDGEGDGFDQDEDMEDLEEEEDLEDEYGGEGRPKGASGKKKRRHPARKSIFELYEPAELERSHLTSRDNEIRNTDSPERFQLRAIKVTPCGEEEIKEESAWIYKNLFTMDMVTRQEKLNPSGRGPHGGRKPDTVLGNISEVLHFMRNDYLEVPFIAYYRKEYYAPELDINDLWLIYKWDEKWCQLKERKRNLVNMYESVASYQVALIARSEDPAAAELPAGHRRVTRRDIGRVQAVESVEEFNDCYLHFQLHYSALMPEVKRALLEERRLERERRRAARRANAVAAAEAAAAAAAENGGFDENGDEIPPPPPPIPIEDDEEDLAEEESEEQLNERMAFLRVSQKRDAYAVCRDFHIDRLAGRFGLTAEQFGEHLSEGYLRYEIEQEPLEPLEAAKEFICRRFPTAEKVLEAATNMVGRQIAVDPSVRKTVRQVFYERAKVWAKPTKRGAKEIDESHYCYSMKYLKDKPISSFVDEQFLLLHQAASEGLVEMKIFIDRRDEDEEEKVEGEGGTGENGGLPPPGSETPSSVHSSSSSKIAPTSSPYLDEIKYLFIRDEFSINVQNWNAQRTQSLKVALRIMKRYFVKELTNRALNEAQFAILQLCGQKLHSHLAVAPFAFNPREARLEEDDEEDFDTRGGVRILALAFDPTNEEASYCASIDGDGAVTDYLKLEHFMLRRDFGPGARLSEKEAACRYNDREKLKKFIFKQKPHAIAIGCDTIVTRHVHEEVCSVVRELHERDRFPLLSVEYLDAEVATIYMNSKRAAVDFPTYPPRLRQAISLARRLQDPLVEFAQLCTADDEVLCLKLHPNQEAAPREELLSVITAEFVNRVNEVGVDINRCLVHGHTAPLVQFVGGLGPRKGAFLVRTLRKQQTPLLENRTQLVQACSVGKNIFINAAGFLKIDTSLLTDSGTDTYIEVLDSTRVHPEAYEWARKMAVDALDYDEDNDTNPAQALEEIIENPEKLRDLDLDEFAKELNRQGMGRKKQTLYDIRTELTERYKDKRRPYAPPDVAAVFTLLTGESEETLHVGKLVMARVTTVARRKPKEDQVQVAQPLRIDAGTWKCPFCQKDDFIELQEVWHHFDHSCQGAAVGVKCLLDCGVAGFIHIKQLSDKEVTDPESRVKRGMTVHCRVLKLQMDRFSVDLTCRSSDLVDSAGRFKKKRDPDYDHEAEAAVRRREEEVRRRAAKRRTYMKRIIVHPSFRNIDFRRAEKLLGEMAQGEAIIRPSSQGNDHLTLSWKVHDGIHMHVDIKEGEKSNVFSLGRQLFIEGETYEDLDEIIARYVQPMAAYARDLTAFKYFREQTGGGTPGDMSAVEKALNEEKQKAPSRIPYIVTPSKEFPGKFLLSYQPKTNPFHEYITITTEGYRYRKITFKTINALFKWFKAHFNDSTTFPRTPGPPQLSTPNSINASPYGAVGGGGSSQRTPGMVSPMVTGGGRMATGGNHMGGGGGFGVPTPNINQQALQRVAASMPSNLFTTLSAVAGQTPQFANVGSWTAAAATPASAAGGFAVPARPPVRSHPFQTPNSYGGHQGGGGGLPMHPGPMPPPPPPPPPGRPPMPSPSSSANNNRPGSRSGNQWAELITSTDWTSGSPAQGGGGRPGAGGGGGRQALPPFNPGGGKPRTPAYSTPGGSSQMSISPAQEETPNIRGDQTPLIDEWTSRD